MHTRQMHEKWKQLVYVWLYRDKQKMPRKSWAFLGKYSVHLGKQRNKNKDRSSVGSG